MRDQKPLSSEMETTVTQHTHIRINKGVTRCCREWWQLRELTSTRFSVYLFNQIPSSKNFWLALSLLVIAVAELSICSLFGESVRNSDCLIVSWSVSLMIGQSIRWPTDLSVSLSAYHLLVYLSVCQLSAMLAVYFVSTAEKCIWGPLRMIPASLVSEISAHH